MLKRILLSLLLALLYSWMFIYDSNTPDINLTKITESLLYILVFYILFHVFVYSLIHKNVRGSHIRYTIKKISGIAFFVFSIFSIANVWIDNAQTLLVTYGFLSASIALAFQEVFRNILGGTLIYINRIYKVGDRIEIGGVVGDVIDIGLMYTSVMEIQNWVDGDQPTGRITSIPNSQILTSNLFNYTKDHQFIWDEIILPVTYDSSWRKAIPELQELITQELKKLILEADAELDKMGELYYMQQTNVKPKIFIRPTDNWLQLHIRHITTTSKRRDIKNDITEMLMEYVDSNKHLKIASETLNIVGFPDVKSR